MKAILVIDNVPNCCVACPFFEFINGDDHNDCRTHCIAKLGLINDYGAEVRPSWCPLKPMPSRKDNNDSEMVGSIQMDIGYTLGWNECIDAITGDTDGTKGETE